MPAAEPPLVLVLGPDRTAISGVSTHLNLLFESSLARTFRLRGFQVGSEGRRESRAGRLARLIISPFALAARVLSERVDVVHVNTSLNRNAAWRDLAYMAVARLCGARVLYQVHGGELPEAFTAGSRVLAPLLRAGLRLSGVIVVLARCELEAYQRFLPGHTVRLLPNAIDHQPYARLVRRLTTGGRPLELLYIGRLVREKGLYDGLLGLRLACDQGAAVHLVIAGGGPDEAGLRQVVSDLQLEREVSFVGAAFGGAKMDLLANADALLLPSHSEGLPYALLECMAAGMPVIATPVGAIPDVVIDGQHGMLVPPGDVQAIARAITRLAANPECLARMGGDCRERIASTYAIQPLLRNFSGLYAELSALRRGATALGA